MKKQELVDVLLMNAEMVSDEYSQAFVKGQISFAYLSGLITSEIKEELISEINSKNI